MVTPTEVAQAKNHVRRAGAGTQREASVYLVHSVHHWYPRYSYYDGQTDAQGQVRENSSQSLDEPFRPAEALPGDLPGFVASVARPRDDFLVNDRVAYAAMAQCLWTKYHPAHQRYLSRRVSALPRGRL